MDTDTKQPLDIVNVYVSELENGTVTGTDGAFTLTGLCAQEYHLTVSHVGCSSELYHIHIESDTSITLYLSHRANVLEEATIVALDEQGDTKLAREITARHVDDRAGLNLASLMNQLPGVSTLKNGAGIAKPVVQGLYGNRITIYNNGIPQSGQQWGNDHSPEIDPLTAKKIEVVRGTDMLSYAGSHIGSMVMIRPQPIGRATHLHGKLNYQYDTNGRGHTMNLQMQQYHPKLAYRVIGTLKRSGDRSAPDYFLNNTGGSEANLALQVERTIYNNWLIEGYLSTFNATLGVLRGSHIGNVTDLEAAIGRAQPFFTEEDFTYSIDAPRQRVNHHLAKIKATKVIDEDRVLHLQLATQYNRRAEFDVRRGGRTETPALLLSQWSFSTEARYEHQLSPAWKLQTGAQHTTTDNTNIPGTGVLPLIPDYRAFESGAYAILRRQHGASTFDLGVRYDNVIMNAVVISRSITSEIIRYNRIFHNPALSGSYKYLPAPTLQLLWQSTLASRNPAVNELYSNGLHQGVSGIEEGDPKLSSEVAFSNTFNLKWEPTTRSTFDLTYYNQRINNYIYLAPQSTTVLTIRGAFPLFIYEQTDAVIDGLDASAYVSFSDLLATRTKYSYIRGRDTKNDLNLIDIPANQLSNTIEITPTKNIKLGSKRLENITLELNQAFTFEKTGILETQDYLLPPDGYFLLGMSLSTELQLRESRARFVLHVDNLLDTKYRDFLNRQRYFADDLGRNVTIGINVEF